MSSLLPHVTFLSSRLADVQSCKSHSLSSNHFLHLISLPLSSSARLSSVATLTLTTRAIGEHDNTTFSSTTLPNTRHFSPLHHKRQPSGSPGAVHTCAFWHHGDFHRSADRLRPENDRLKRSMELVDSAGKCRRDLHGITTTQLRIYGVHTSRSLGAPTRKAAMPCGVYTSHTLLHIDTGGHVHDDQTVKITLAAERFEQTLEQTPQPRDSD